MDISASTQLVELKCKNCGAPLSPADFSAQLMAARCPHCQAVFAISNPATPSIGRPDASLPHTFQMNRTPQGLEIIRSWFEAKVWFILFFAIFWNGFMLVWHGIALSSGMWFMSAFGLIHTGIGLFLIYLVLAMFLNSTVIRANATSLEVKTGPLPWKGDKQINTAEVRQLYCLEKISQGKNGTSSSYRVEAVMRDNRRETLIGGLSDPDHALFIEQQIERHLGLIDIPVAGEYGR